MLLFDLSLTCRHIWRFVSVIIRILKRKTRNIRKLRLEFFLFVLLWLRRRDFFANIIFRTIKFVYTPPIIMAAIFTRFILSQLRKVPSYFPVTIWPSRLSSFSLLSSRPFRGSKKQLETEVVFAFSLIADLWLILWKMISDFGWSPEWSISLTLLTTHKLARLLLADGFRNDWYSSDTRRL